MRIIAGKYRGFTLNTIPGKLIRPTPSKVREAIFDIIGFKVVDSDFLDLFAGTGAIGIEAISRGAKSVTFVERNRNAIELINTNLTKIGEKETATIVKNDYIYSLKFLNEQQKKYDIIFLDPPYNKDLLQKTLNEIDRSSLLKNNSIIIAQYQIHEKMQNNFSRIQTIKEKRYGKTKVTIFSYNKQFKKGENND